MEKKVLIPLVLVIVFITVVGFFIKIYPTFNTTSTKNEKVAQKIVTIGSKNINIEIADTNELREKGLGGRSTLPENNGMLFVFDSKPVMVNFWMKDMLMPIDIIWIANNKITKIDKNVPFYPAGTPDNQLKVYGPSSPIDYVLEVNSGFSAKNNIKVGDVATLPAL